MGRKRTIEIHETAHALISEISQATDPRVERALRLLLALKRDPTLSNAELAVETGYSVSTVKRIVSVYRDDGLTGLKERARTNRASRVAAPAADPEVTLDRTEREWYARYHKVMRLVQGVPKSLNQPDFLAGMRDELLTILDDVDYMVLRVSVTASLSNPMPTDCQVTFSNVIFQKNDEGMNPKALEPSVHHTQQGSDWQRILEDGRLRKVIEFSKYHPCHGIDLLYTSVHGSCSIASILFFREIEQQPSRVSARVRDLEIGADVLAPFWRGAKEASGEFITKMREL